MAFSGKKRYQLLETDVSTNKWFKISHLVIKPLKVLNEENQPDLIKKR